MEFTERELSLLSDGLLRLMSDAWRAEGVFPGESSVVDAIESYTKELQRLNTKICNYMEG